MHEISFEKSKWINIASPTPESLAVLKKKYRFHRLDLEDCLQESQRPKIDEYEKYLFIVLQFPNFNKRSGRFDIVQLNMFVGQNYLITIYDGELTELSNIFDKCRKSAKARESYFGRCTGYLLYEVLSSLFDSVFPITDKIQLSLKKIEGEIFEAQHPKDQLFDIMVRKKDIITLRKVMLPQRSVIAALEHKQKRFIPEDLVIYFDDIVDQIEKLWNILETQKEYIGSLEDTNESMLSHNMNLTMRTLTVFSAIMLPLTFLTGLFGMNVKLPFITALESVGHFWKIVIALVTVIIVLFGIFKWKKWI